MLLVTGAGLAGIALLALVLWARRHLLLATVDGASMEPTFQAGDRVLVRRRRLPRVRAGEVVVVRRPDRMIRLPGQEAEPMEREWNLKRAVALPGDVVPEEVLSAGSATVPEGAFVVLGDNRAASADSRIYGFYYSDQLFGVVVRELR
ncbi:S26 family signal peptidase [Flindersiella endophytica]